MSNLNKPPFQYDANSGEVINEDGLAIMMGVDAEGTTMEDQDTFMEMVVLLLNQER
tara:strand:- start:3944 stop:4111 length:168 start_codon:yes stop_codon:yes gene_type:complete